MYCCFPEFFVLRSSTPLEVIKSTDNYQIIHRISYGLKAHTKFTGRQFLIINHDPFDWIDVNVTINTRTRENQSLQPSLESGASIFAIPRIRAGEVYTLQTNNLAAQALPGLQDSPTQTYDLRILATTPWGQSSWDGRWEKIASWAPCYARHDNLDRSIDRSPQIGLIATCRPALLSCGCRRGAVRRRNSCGLR